MCWDARRDIIRWDPLASLCTERLLWQGSVRELWLGAGRPTARSGHQGVAQGLAAGR